MIEWIRDIPILFPLCLVVGVLVLTSSLLFSSDGDGDVDGDSDGDVDGDMDGDGDSGGQQGGKPLLSYLSVKNLSCYLTGFGLTGTVMWDKLPGPVVMILSLVVGFCFAWVMFFLMRKFARFASCPVATPDHLVGREAEVTIPVTESGGEVVTRYRGSKANFRARLDSGEEGGRLATGSKVVVTRVEKSVLVVKNG